MRAVIQRVLNAKVEVDSRIVGQIENGLLVYISIGNGDSDTEAEFMAGKLTQLRIFNDDNGKMNRSLLDIDGEILLISNFTLHGNCRKGRRPSFDAAADPKPAEKLYEKVAELLSQKPIKVKKGIFGAHMHVSSTNDGPVTFLLIN